jgi:hypothetical protein
MNTIQDNANITNTIKEVDKNVYYNLPTQEETESNEQNDPNYGRTKGLYSEKLLKLQRRQHFITIPQSTQETSILLENLKKASKGIKYICVAQEEHTDGGKHHHILVTATAGIRIGAIHKRIMETAGNIGGGINYQQVDTLKAVETYIKKDDKYEEWGEITTQKHTKDTKDELEGDLNELYTNEKTIEENLEIFQAKQPAYYTQYYENILIHLQRKDNKILKRWKPKEWTHENTTLKPYQKKIWNLLQSEPKERQIIWVKGKPGSGKSFMFNYINQNYEYGIYNAGSTASQDNAVYGYEGQGAIAWDIPLNYDFENYGDALASTIEKFSDYGQYLTSRKYKGKKIQVTGHVIVFSNSSVLDQLKHRDIICINTRDDETEEQKLMTWNTRKLKHPITGNPHYEVRKETAHNGTERSYFTYDALPSYIKDDVYDL